MKIDSGFKSSKWIQVDEAKKQVYWQTTNKQTNDDDMEQK